MAFVWKHPSLTLLEVLWRWCAAAPLLWFGWTRLAGPWRAIPLQHAALASLTFLEPVQSAATLAQQARLFLPALLQTARWWVPLALLLWTALSTGGRTAVLRRADPGLKTAYGHMAWINLLRAAAFLTLLGLWLLAVAGAVHSTITGPSGAGGEPNVVLFTAETIGLTLAAFLLWSLAVWGLDLLPVAAMAQRATRSGAQRRELRSKLVETNLVMGIVRVALLVLAMTFSASPLPFQSQQTQAFITVWWMVVGVFYVVASDFFHVVRRVTYLRLLQSIALDTNESGQAAS